MSIFLNRWFVTASAAATFYVGWVIFLCVFEGDHHFHWDALLFSLVGILQGPLYLLPSIIGLRKRNALAIFLLNLLTGWTGIGWIAALIWSVTKDAA
jgi:hypothetical protein